MSKGGLSLNDRAMRNTEIVKEILERLPTPWVIRIMDILFVGASYQDSTKGTCANEIAMWITCGRQKHKPELKDDTSGVGMQRRHQQFCHAAAESYRVYSRHLIREANRASSNAERLALR